MSLKNEDVPEKLQTLDKKKIKDMSSEEKREYQRKKQQECRDRKKAELEGKNISKNAAPEQKKELDRKRKQKNRKEKRSANETVYLEKNADQMQKQREEKRAMDETVYLRKNADQMQKQREEKRAVDETGYLRKNADQMQKQREEKRGEDEASYLRKNAEQMQRQRDKKHADSKSRIQTYRQSVMFGRIFECICCHRRLFEDAVWKIKDETAFKTEMEQKFPGLFNAAINEIVTRKAPQGIIDGKEIAGSYHLCFTCKTHLNKGQMPPMSHQNNLQLVDISEHQELNLTEVENNLIARNLIFQKIYQLPKSRAPGMKDRTINIPIYEADVLKTVESLPRTPTEAGIIPVKLKRKVEYKNSHKVQYICVDKVFKALQTLKEKGNKYYQFIPETEDFKEKCRSSDIEGFNLLFPDEAQSIDDPDIQIKKNDLGIAETDMDESVLESNNAKANPLTPDIFKDLNLFVEKAEDFKEKCRSLDIKGFNLLFTDEAPSMDDPDIKIKKNNLTETYNDDIVLESNNAKANPLTPNIIKDFLLFLEKLNAIGDQIDEQNRKKHFDSKSEPDVHMEDDYLCGESGGLEPAAQSATEFGRSSDVYSTDKEGQNKEDRDEAQQDVAEEVSTFRGPGDLPENIEDYLSERIKIIDEKMEKLKEFFNSDSNDEEFDSDVEEIKGRELYMLQDEMSELVDKFGDFF